MPVMHTDPRDGNRITTPLLTLSAANTTGTLWTQPTDGQTAIIRKLMVFSSDTNSANLSIGTGTPHASFTAQLPKFFCVAGMDTSWTEDQIPAFEFPAVASPTTAQITAEVDAHTAGSIIVQAELELFPGSTVHA